MQERPAGDLVNSLRSVGCSITYMKNEGSLPIEVKASGLKGGRIELKATTSSQFVSSLLLSAPFAQQPVTLVLKGEVVSRPYIDMTIELMRTFGIDVKELTGQSEVTFEIPLGVYKNPPTLFVEPDASSATYPFAVAAITGGKVTVKGVLKKEDSLQGDAGFPWLLEKMGCTVTVQTDSITVQGPPLGTLKAIDIDMNTMTDAFLTAAALMATVPGGKSRITNIANQRVKECNRIEAMRVELGKCGVECRELPDGIEVDGKRPEDINGASIHCYNDHRVAMAFGCLGCVAKGIVITDKACVDKTYPEFWGHLRIHMGAAFDTTAAIAAAAEDPEREHSEEERPAKAARTAGGA